MQTIPITEHATKARPPEFILERYSHFLGTAEGTQLRTGVWANVRQWYAENRDKAPVVLAVVDSE
jgi:hypothetical protein